MNSLDEVNKKIDAAYKEAGGCPHSSTIKLLVAAWHLQFKSDLLILINTSINASLSKIFSSEELDTSQIGINSCHIYNNNSGTVYGQSTLGDASTSVDLDELKKLIESLKSLLSNVSSEDVEAFKIKQ